MAGRRLEVVDVREVLRQLRMGESDRQIASRTDISRNTVARYRNWAEEKDLLQDVLPAPELLNNLGTVKNKMKELWKPLWIKEKSFI